MKDIVTVEEAATFLHKHPDTIRRWIEEKKLKAKHLSAGGHGVYAILRSDLLELMVTQSIRQKEKSKEKIHHNTKLSFQTLLPI